MAKTKTGMLIIIFCSLTGWVWAEEPKPSTESPQDFLGLPGGVQVHSKDATADRILELWNKGEKRAANKELDKWMSSDGKSPDPWVLKARFYYEEGHFKKCLSVTQKALKRSPQCAPAYYWRGRAFESLGKPLESANEYQAAVHADSHFEEAKKALDSVMATIEGTGLTGATPDGRASQP